MLPFQLLVALRVGQPAGSSAVASHVLAGESVLQKRSVVYCGAKQKPVGQSSSERHGEQNVPSPTQVPARGVHTLSEPHVCPAAQSALPPHSGVQCPPEQCWYVPPAAGQSSSLAHAAPLAGVHTVNCRVQTWSSGQLDVFAHSSAQKVPELEPEPVVDCGPIGTQCCGVPADASGLEQSRSVAQGAHDARGRHTWRVAPAIDAGSLVIVTLGAAFTSAHHQAAGHSVSVVQPKNVQNELASVGLVP
jgi:hypothetical protein